MYEKGGGKDAQNIHRIFTLMAMTIPALAETSAKTYVVDVGYQNPILISSDGEQLTEVGEYTSIRSIADEDCPADQKLYEVMFRGTEIDANGYFST